MPTSSSLGGNSAAAEEEQFLDVVISYFASSSSGEDASLKSKQTSRDSLPIHECGATMHIPLVTLLGISTSSSWNAKTLKDCTLYRYFKFLRENLANHEEAIGELCLLWRQYLESNIDASGEHSELVNLVILEVSEHLLAADVISIFKNPPEHYFISFSGNKPEVPSNFTIKNMIDELLEKSTAGSSKKRLTKLHLDLRSTDTNPFTMSHESFHLQCELEGFREHTDIRRKKYVQYSFKISIHDPANVKSSTVWSVRKRFTDFESLHENLTKLSSEKDSSDYFDCDSLPDLPSKYTNTDPEFRKVHFLEYMQALIRLVDLYPNRIVLAFLGLLNESLMSSPGDVEKGEFNSSNTSNVGNSGTGVGKANRHVLHTSKLLTELDTGDLILFRSKSKTSQLQRSVTGSEWDHIGVVVRVTNSSYIRMKDAVQSEHTKKTSVANTYFGSNPADSIDNIFVNIKRSLTSLVGSKKDTETTRESLTKNSILLKSSSFPAGNRGYEASKYEGKSDRIRGQGGLLLCILECTGEGVTLLPLQSRIKAYNYYDCCHYIAVRRLSIPDNRSWEKVYLDHSNAENSELFSCRTNYDPLKLSSFLSTVVGLPYLFRVTSIATTLLTSEAIVSGKDSNGNNSSSRNNNNNNNNNSSGSNSNSKSIAVHQNRAVDKDQEGEDQFESSHVIQPAYFCSELVAAMLKVLKVLPISVKNDLLWPGSFASGDVLDKIILHPHVYGPEMILDCRVNDVNEVQSVTPRSTEGEQVVSVNPVPKPKPNQPITYSPPVFDHHRIATFTDHPKPISAIDKAMKSPAVTVTVTVTVTAATEYNSSQLIVAQSEPPSLLQSNVTNDDFTGDKNSTH